MVRRRSTNWMDLSVDAWQAAIEAQHVIALRLTKIAMGGGAASAEAQRMVSEKIAAAVQVQGDAAMAMLGGATATIPAQTMRTLRRKMRANRRRLMRDFQS